MDVRYRQVSKSFGSYEALAPLDLYIADGAFLALLGPSGCGKTTALRLLAGLERPSTGQIYIGDRDVTFMATKDRDIAMVFQSYALYPHLKVVDNIGYPLRVRRVDPTERLRQVRKVAELLGLEDYLERRPGQLSGGQRQRVMAARALVQDAPVLLLDEPLSGVDPASARLIEAVFRDLRASGRTLLVASHDVESARSYDRVLCLNRRQVAFGDPATALARDTLQATYGHELIVLEDGRAVTVQHHEHGGEEGHVH